jgi:hypothetical protein
VYDGLTDGQTGENDEAKIRFSQLRERAYKCYNQAALNSSAGSLISNLKTPHLAFTTKFKIMSGTTSSEREYIYSRSLEVCVCVCVCVCIYIYI